MLNFSPDQFCNLPNSNTVKHKKTDCIKFRGNDTSDNFAQNSSRASSEKADAGIRNKIIKHLPVVKDIKKIELMQLEMPEVGNIEEIGYQIAKTQDEDKRLRQTIKFINEYKDDLFLKDKDRISYYGGKGDPYVNGHVLKYLFNKFSDPKRIELFKLLLQKKDYDYHRIVFENLDLKNEAAQELFYQIVDNSNSLYKNQKNHFVILGFDRYEDFPEDKRIKVYFDLKSKASDYVKD